MTIIRTMLATTAALGLVTAASAQTSGAASGGGKSARPTSKTMAKSHARTAHASSGYNQTQGARSKSMGAAAMSGSGSGGSTTTMANTSSGVMSH